MTPSAIRVEAVGGLGEMGHHHLVLDLGPDSFLIDCGMLMPAPSDPGFDRIVPSFAAAQDRWDAGTLRALILTHGHLDHVGAVADLLAALPDLPVYGTPWALAMLRRRLERRDPPLAHAPRLVAVQPGGSEELGATTVQWLPVTHSLPEACSVAFRSAAGCVVHSGDFRVQHDPLLGPPCDVAGLRAVGDAGVDLALVDSTGSAMPGRTLPERDVAARLLEVVSAASGRVLVTSFSSHLERIYACVLAARATGRRLCVYGRSAEETKRLGVERGLLPLAAGELLSVGELRSSVPHESLVFVTGSQGEWRAPLPRIARGEDPNLSVGPGDLVIFSSRAIPGTERSIGAVVNALVERGAQVIPPWGPESLGLHTSGHGRADDVAEWLSWVRPARVVPVHGEPAHLVAHRERLRHTLPALELLDLRSGQRLDLDPKTGVSRVRAGVAGGATVVVEGGQRFAAGDRALGDRRKLARTGGITVVVPWRDGKATASCVVGSIGVVPAADEQAFASVLAAELDARMAEWAPVLGAETARDRVQVALRQLARDKVGTKPVCRATLWRQDRVVSYDAFDAKADLGTEHGAEPEDKHPE